MYPSNSLERAFTVLTYLLSSKEFYPKDNQKVLCKLPNTVYFALLSMTCNVFDTTISNIAKADGFITEWNDLLGSVDDDLMKVQYELQNKKEKITREQKPHDCGDKSLGELFCEDNRYSTNLLLIGRGQRPLTRELYQKFLNGISCNRGCIESDNDFFIGKTKFLQLVSKKLFEMLFVYIDTDGMEHFHYFPEFEFDGKKLDIRRLIKSMTDMPLKELIEKEILDTTSIKSWKLFLKKK